MTLASVHEHDHLGLVEHSHDHHHHPRPAGETPPAGGPVVLDIGGDIGALIVELEGHRDELIGHELYIRPVETPDAHATHTGIWPRRLGQREAVVAVFPELRAGRYDLLDVDLHHQATVTIAPGAVAQLRLALHHH